jgi:type I restriction enzyme, S subunit
MNNWKTYKLGDLVLFQRGHDLTVADITPGSYPVAGSNGPIGFHSKYTTKGPSLTIGRSGNSIGVAHFYQNDFWAHNTTLYAKEFFNCNPKFLFYFLKTLDLGGHNSGSAVPSLNRNYINPIQVSVPDLPTQTRIASILSALDDKIELNRRTNQTLEQMAQTLFKKYFVTDIDPDNLPEGWRWGKFSDIIEFSNGYAFSSKALSDEDNGNSFHVFKMAHIKKGGGFSSDSTKSFFDKSKAAGLEKYILKKGDLLMCMTDMKDSMALLGHTALMNEDDRFIVNQRVGLIRINNNDEIDYPFVYLLTNSKEFIEDLRSRANSGVQVNLSTNEIKESKIIIPETEINRKFNDIVKPMFEKIFEATKENEKLVAIRDTLLPKLMSGEINVN